MGEDTPPAPPSPKGRGPHTLAPPPAHLALIHSSQGPEEWLGLAYLCQRGLPLWLSVKESSCNEGDVGSIPGLGRSPGVENGNLLQCSCLENSKRSLAGYRPRGHQELDTSEHSTVVSLTHTQDKVQLGGVICGSIFATSLVLI